MALSTSITLFLHNKISCTRLFITGEISDDDFQKLCLALKQDPYSLAALQLSNNNLGNEKLAAIGNALRYNTSIKELIITGNNIDDERVGFIVQILQNDILEYLNLANNCIGPKGVQDIANALRNNTSLERCHLFNNPIGREGIEVLASILETHQKLEGFHIDDNKMEDEEKIEIEKNITFEPRTLKYGMPTIFYFDEVKEEERVEREKHITFDQCTLTYKGLKETNNVIFISAKKELEDIHPENLEINIISQNPERSEAGSNVLKTTKESEAVEEPKSVIKTEEPELAPETIEISPNRATPSEHDHSDEDSQIPVAADLDVLEAAKEPETIEKPEPIKTEEPKFVPDPEEPEYETDEFLSETTEELSELAGQDVDSGNGGWCTLI